VSSSRIGSIWTTKTAWSRKTSAVSGIAQPITRRVASSTSAISTTPKTCSVGVMSSTKMKRELTWS
jgi:hypothetical protein